MQAVRVATLPSFGILEKRRLFSVNGYFASPWAQAYDVSPDGRRFLMLRVGSASGAVPGSPILDKVGALVLVQNFLTDLQRQVP